jgi:hypothetical protein
VQPPYHYIARRKNRHCQPYPGGTQVQQLVVVPVPREPNTPTLAVVDIPRSRKPFGWFLLPGRLGCDATMWHPDFCETLGVPTVVASASNSYCTPRLPYRNRFENLASHSILPVDTGAPWPDPESGCRIGDGTSTQGLSDRTIVWLLCFMLCRAIPIRWREIETYTALGRSTRGTQKVRG